MNSNHIIYADLSTYTPKKTIAFYETVFGWRYYQDSDYYLAYHGDDEVAGLYETPDKYKQMRMPHFWMTYIQVNNINDIADKARSLGGIVEMEQAIAGFGKIALIRDPLGAGFTVYQGGNLKSSRTIHKENTLIWNELHVSDADKVIPFYEGIFDWHFVKRATDHYQIITSRDEHIADAFQIANEHKGKYEYWICTFGAKDLQKTKALIVQNGGQLVSDETDRLLMTDNSGEAFFYIQAI